MLSRRLATMSALGLVLSAAGCGSLSGDTGSPSPLTNIHGTIMSDSGSPPPASLATAIVWFGMSADGSFQESADSVPVTGTFPATFEIALTAIPPASAMFDFRTVFGSPEVAATGVQVALGFVVAYDDRNGNGRLDIVDPGASEYIDKIEGVADRLIFYLDQPVPTSLVTSPQFTALGIDGSTPQKGYNLFLPESNYCFADADAGSVGSVREGQYMGADGHPRLTLAGKGPRDCSPGPAAAHVLHGAEFRHHIHLKHPPSDDLGRGLFGGAPVDRRSEPPLLRPRQLRLHLLLYAQRGQSSLPTGGHRLHSGDNRNARSRGGIASSRRPPAGRAWRSRRRRPSI